MNGVYSLYVFTSAGTLLYMHDFSPRIESRVLETADEAKLVYGLLKSVSHLNESLSTTPRDVDVSCVRTTKFVLHHYESLTKFKFALSTDASVSEKKARDFLRRLYAQVFCPLVRLDPLTPSDLNQVDESFKLPRKFLAESVELARAVLDDA